ncbi:hypothetical protein [Neisseria sp. P0019.S002]|uniref:hypothetical protein n=1 Tax=Neisseria sp. P0019.S002 TaxID=3436798 RepID=UPI003F7F2EA2
MLGDCRCRARIVAKLTYPVLFALFVFVYGRVLVVGVVVFGAGGCGVVFGFGVFG